MLDGVSDAGEELSAVDELDGASDTGEELDGASDTGDELDGVSETGDELDGASDTSDELSISELYTWLLDGDSGGGEYP